MEKSLKFRQSKGNNSSITDDIPSKLHVHNITIVMYIQYEFHEMLSISYLFMAIRGRQKSLKFRQSKNNNSTITDNTPFYVHVHNFTMAIYIQHKFHEIPSICYLAVDGFRLDRRKDGWKD